MNILNVGLNQNRYWNNNVVSALINAEIEINPSKDEPSIIQLMHLTIGKKIDSVLNKNQRY